MTFQQLNYIITVSEIGSINRAADGREFLPYARQVYDQYLAMLDKYGKSGNRRQKFGVSCQHYSFAVKAFVEMAKAYDMAQYDFAIREVRTSDVIADVAQMHSEIGILFLSDFNRGAITRLLRVSNLSFHHLISCSAYVYLWRGHPLADRKSIGFADLEPYPCLSFEQGDESSIFLNEEILSENDYPRIIKTADRATNLNLMTGLNAYTLCPGIVCEELNGPDFVAVPYEADTNNPNSIMDIGYIVRSNAVLSAQGARYLEEIRKYLGGGELH